MTHVKTCVFFAFCTKMKSDCLIHCCIFLIGGRVCFRPGGRSFTDSLPRNSILLIGYTQPCIPGSIWKCAPSKTGSFKKRGTVMTKLFSCQRRLLLVHKVDIQLETVTYGHSRKCIFGFVSFIIFFASHVGFRLIID